MEDTVDLKFEGTFKGEDYIVSVKSVGEQLSIQLESKYEPIWWSNSFSAGYLEDLTQKTGVRRKYADFVEDLVQGLTKRTETQNVDILTFQDLQNMRNTNSSNDNPNELKKSHSNASNSSSTSNKKRYLIVIAEVLGEQVHYPLSLNLDDVDNIELLRSHLRKMKLEVDELKEKSIKTSDGDPLSSKGSFSSKININMASNQFHVFFHLFFSTASLFHFSQYLA